MKRKRLWKWLLAEIMSLAVAMSSVPATEARAVELESVAESECDLHHS